MSIFKKFSIVLSAVLLSATFSFSAVAEESKPETEPEVYEDLSVEDEEVKEEEKSAIQEYTVFEAIRIRRDLLAKGGKYTLDDYKTVSKFLVNNSMLNIRYFTLSYDTQGYDVSAYANEPEVLDPVKVIYKSYAKIIPANLGRDGYINMGWEYDGKVYGPGDRFKMPACDVVMTPVWTRRSKVNYYAGDYDDIIGNSSLSITSAQGAQFALADANRFSRKGYTISGWLSSIDGKVYEPGMPYTVPSVDTDFEAVWSPAVYDINISANNGNIKDKIVMSGTYNEEFVLPECEFENSGKTFAGWKYNGEIYQPGESFTVPALITGQKITVVATWQ